MSLRAGQDAYGLINFGDADPLYGQIGARLSRLWTLDNGSAIETSGCANLWRAFGGDANTTFTTLSGADPVRLGTSLGGTSAQFGLGASRRIVRNVAVFASADCNLAVDGGRGHSYDGRIGVKIAWWPNEPPRDLAPSLVTQWVSIGVRPQIHCSLLPGDWARKRDSNRSFETSVALIRLKTVWRPVPPFRGHHPSQPSDRSIEENPCPLCKRSRAPRANASISRNA